MASLSGLEVHVDSEGVSSWAYRTGALAVRVAVLTEELRAEWDGDKD